jgi:ubiquinone/menaquinone biosynthesis C-methylase UbiE
VKTIVYRYTFIMSLERKSSSNESSLQKKYQDTNIVARFANREFFKTVLKLTRDLDFSTVLDAGCGEGVPLSLLIKQNPAGQAAGVDLDPDRVRIARQRIPTAHFLISNAQSLPFSSQSFDLLVSLETLEHMGYPERALSEYARITRRYILLSVPHEPWWRLGNMARLKYLPNLGNTPGHINHWTRRGFRSLIRAHFRILKIANPFLWTFVLAEKK